MMLGLGLLAVALFWAALRYLEQRREKITVRPVWQPGKGDQWVHTVWNCYECGEVGESDILAHGDPQRLAGAQYLVACRKGHPNILRGIDLMGQRVLAGWKG